MIVECPRCGNLQVLRKGIHNQARCLTDGCTRTLTPRHEYSVPGGCA